MKAFVWVVVALLALETLGKLIQLGRGFVASRTPRELAIDVFGNACLLCWAFHLLAAS